MASSAITRRSQRRASIGPRSNGMGAAGRDTNAVDEGSLPRGDGRRLGSASIELTVEEEDRKQTVVFSGDLGPRGAPIVRDSVPFDNADVVVVIIGPCTRRRSKRARSSEGP